MMIELWKRRVRQHQKKMMKYLKYIFNDHFVIVCLFLVGAMGYAYSNYLKTITSYDVKGQLIGIIIFTGVLSIGKLATIIQAADAVFMLPKEEAMGAYFEQAKWRSLWLPSFIIIVTVGVLMPLLVAMSGFAFSDMFYFVLMLIILKETDLNAQVLNLKIKESKEWIKIRLLLFGIYFIVSGFALLISPIMGLVGAVVVTVSYRAALSRKSNAQTYQWEKMLKDESNRMKRIYQFINLFTDIPALKGSVKRRAYLDGFLKKIQKNKSNVFYYLYARAFLRGTEYSGLYIRLVGIAMLLSGLGSSFILSVFFTAIFLYLTGFQLLPLYFHFDNLSSAVLYPIKQNDKLQSLKKLLSLLMMFEGLLITATSAIHLSFIEVLVLLISSVVFNLGFCQFYLPIRINKMMKSQQ
ncbi:ABC transporter permease [Carnobacterium sp. ISL-102]|uniref:ABC transporter permease n=1 Tax=Carnobacterium sp. ISL-102 TaxID=2819142 RepID=UPI001BEA8E46|nr:ABC transporter permease [Carnobacterium sp. ISL-102]MBT2731229.1 ABC transporter permease [Carnobacterium sp. ISL-102]